MLRRLRTLATDISVPVVDATAVLQLAVRVEDRRLRRDARPGALDESVGAPPDTRLYLVAGDAEPTPATVTVRDDGNLQVTQRGPGDGTVLRSSALLDERVGGEWQRTLRTPIHWSGTMFLFRDHLGLTSDPVFTDNVLHILLETD